MRKYPRTYHFSFSTPANDKARDFIFNEMQKVMKNGAGTHVDGEFKNVISGDVLSKVLVGAHYDSVPGSPGADDNASAVAVMLAVLKYFGSVHRGISYCAFNGEETGLQGSYELVKSKFFASLKHVHILEMVGYRDTKPNSQKNPVPFLDCPTTGDFLGIVSNSDEEVGGIISCAAAVNIPVLGFGIPSGISISQIQSFSPHLLRSDHAPFWQHRPDIKATMWTDTSEFRNPHYHQSTDTPDTLDYEFMAEITKLLILHIRLLLGEKI